MEKRKLGNSGPEVSTLERGLAQPACKLSILFLH